MTLQTDSNSDPCSKKNIDIAAAIMSDSIEEQEALVNRAILVRGMCESK